MAPDETPTFIFSKSMRDRILSELFGNNMIMKRFEIIHETHDMIYSEVDFCLFDHYAVA
jgi:hypothetical protein